MTKCIDESNTFFSPTLDKFWYCRLSPNHKLLHYGDIEELSQGQIPHDSLQEKGGWSQQSVSYTRQMASFTR